MLKRILSVIIILCMTFMFIPTHSPLCEYNKIAITVHAETTGSCGDNLQWYLDDEGTLLIKGNGEMTNYKYTSSSMYPTSPYAPQYSWDKDTNPPWFNQRELIKHVIIDYGVTSIGNDAFYSCENMESVQISNSVKSIGSTAFYLCTSLGSVILPDSVISISGAAFMSCKQLQSIEIPNSVEKFGIQVFNYCDNLVIHCNKGSNAESYAQQNGIPYVYIGNNTSSGTPKGGISGKYNNGLVWTLDENGTLTITGVGEINEVPWDEYWEDISSVVIGEGITGICDSAFEWYENLTAVTLPSTLQSIGILAFRGSGLTSVMIPANVNSIGWGAFYNCDYLEAIDVSASNSTFKGEDGILFSKNMDELLQFPAGKNQQNYQVPDSVDYIGMFAFGCCNHLSNVAVSDTVTYIADYAFSDCENLTSFNITKNVDTIGWGVFAGCTKLPSISVSSDNPYYCDQNGVVFTNDMTVLVQYPAGKTGSSYTVPNSVSIVGGSAFNSCINLQSVVIPDSVRNINRNAFFYCENLSSITFQNPFCLIDETESTICNGYDDNDNIYFSGTIKGYTNSGAHVYAQKYGYQFEALTNSLVSLPVTGKCGDQLNWKLDGTGTLTVSGTGDMTSSPWLEDYQMDIQAVVIENGVTSIQYDSFSGCRNMFSLELSDTVTHIGENAFNQCVSLEAVSIPAKTTYIGEAAFADCWALSAFEVDTNNPEFISVDGVLYTKDMTILHQYPAGKEGTSYIIPDTVKRISAQAFTNASLEAVKIPDSVVFIGMNAFLYCTYLKTVNIPKGLGIITEGTFSNCVSLENISIPDNVIRIGMFAFEECDSLTRITIPKSVELIYERAFLNCSNLTAIEVADGNPEYVSVDGVLFTKDQSELLVYPCAKSGTSYSVPTTVKTIGDCAFRECNNLTSLILLANVQIIDRFAITDCQNVTSIYFYNAQCSFNDEDNVPISNGTDDDGYAYYNGTIYGTTNSTAQTFANEYGYKFALLSAAPVIQPTTKDVSLGDVNDDGSINAKDANAILIAAARLGTGNTSGLSAELEKAADVNGDGIINAKDASIILRYAAAVGTGQKVSLEDFA